MNLSIIIPAFNESESLNELHDWISKVVKRMNIIYEIIIIDDGSSDDTWSEIKKITNHGISKKQINNVTNNKKHLSFYK